MKEKIKKANAFLKKWLGIISDTVVKYIVKYNFIIFLAVFSIVAFVLRIKLYKFKSSDYIYFIDKWLGLLRGKSFRTAMRDVRKSSDYTTPYMTFLFFVSRFNQSKWLLLVKLNSILFDFILAVFVGLICRKITKNNTYFLMGYAITLLFPNVIINGAVWGQCDSIWTALIVISVYLLLCNKNNWAMVVYGLSLGVKLQAVFFAPVLVYLIAKKKLNIFSLLWIIVGIIITVLPALCCGISFKTAFFDVYKKQKGEYKDLSLNSPNLYRLITYTANYGLYENEPNYLYKDWVSAAGVLFTVCFIGIMTIILVRKKFNADAKTLSSVFFLYAICIPFLLPHMHERYWYLADIAGIIYLILHPKKFFVPLISHYPSFRVNVGFLFNQHGKNVFSAYAQFWIFYVILMAVGFVLCIASVYQDILGAQKRYSEETILNATLKEAPEGEGVTEQE